MNTAISTARAEYLDRVAAGLADLPEEDREEVLQDLRAHLAEVDEDAIYGTLGAPEAFVEEFRSSAGLDEKAGALPRLAGLREKLEVSSRRLGELTRWETIRPLWIWSRGWMLVATLAVFTGGTVFRRFPIPMIEESSIVGLAIVGLATWLSVWLDRRRTPIRMAVSALFNVATALLLAVSMIGAAELSRNHPFAVEPYLPDQLVGSGGEPVENIYAYDLDGEPVEVLLFDQDGRPLLSLPDWVYEEAERHPGRPSPIDYGGGAVEFNADEFGRIIPNLYPLDLYTYGEYGLEERLPPALGFPGTRDVSEDTRDVSEEQSPVTTISPDPVD